MPNVPPKNRPLFQMKNQEVKYEERIVAFIDILGFKEIIKQSEKDSSKVELIYSVLEFLKNWETSEKWDLKLVEIEEDAQYKGVENFDIRGKTNSTAFSDSILVSVKVDNNVNEMTSTLIANLAYIGAVLLERGILIRGGLTIGNIFHNQKGTVFGQGLIEAFQLESHYAKYPRIILSDKLIRKLIYPLTTKKDRFPYHQYLDRFEDGCVGFHQMQYYQVMESWEEMTTDKLTNSLEKVREVILKGLDNSFENPSVFDKYQWLKKQYHKLIILDDFDYNTKSEENILIKIKELNDGMAGHNIHYEYTDQYHKRLRKKQ